MYDRKKILLIAGAVVIAVWMFGSFQRSARIYPRNEVAAAEPMTQLKYKPENRLEGRIEAMMRSGEKFTGRYVIRTKTDEIEEDEDDIYTLRETDNGLSNNYRRLIDMTHGASTTDKRKYYSRMQSAQGNILECEYYIAMMGQEGVGSCRSNHGGKYHILF